MKLATETIGKHQIEIEVQPQSGKFTAEFNEQDFTADTRAELVDKLKTAVKRADRVKPIAVTVIGLVEKKNRKSWDTERFIEGPGVVDAVLRGYHDRNRRWLLTSVDGKQKFQVGGYSSEKVTITRRLTLAEVMEHGKKLEALRVATTDLEDFIGAVKVDPRELLEKGDRDGE